MAMVTPRVEQEQELYSWEGPARPYKKFNSAAFSTPVVIVILVAIILVVAAEWMLILLLAALVFVMYAWMMVPPERITYTISNRGIRIGQTLYVWEAMSRWWVEQQWGSAVVLIESGEALAGRLAIPLEAAHQKKVEETLGLFLLREAPTPTTTDKAAQWLVNKFPLAEMGEEKKK